MGANCSIRSVDADQSLDASSVDQSLAATLTEDPTLLEMGFGAEVCRLYDYIESHSEDNGTSSLMVTKKEIPASLLHKTTPTERESNRTSASTRSVASERPTLMLKRISGNPIFMMRWHHTIDVLSELNHPNLPRVIDIHDEDHDKVTIVMEACEGPNLMEQLQEQQSVYSEGSARKILKQVLGLVKYLHDEQNIVHGDLRAEWFLFETTTPNKQYHIKLTDFSLAQQLDDKTQEDDQAIPRSTAKTRIHHDHEPCLHTTAPEIVNGRAHSKKGDMFSIGVILYRLLSGERPFGEDTQALLNNMREGPTLDFSKPVWKTVSPLAKDLIQKLLAVQPKQRLTAKQALKHGWFSPNSIRSCVATVRSSLTRPSLQNNPSLIV